MWVRIVPLSIVISFPICASSKTWCFQSLFILSYAPVCLQVLDLLRAVAWMFMRIFCGVRAKNLPCYRFFSRNLGLGRGGRTGSDDDEYDEDDEESQLRRRKKKKNCCQRLLKTIM
jgi:hypothetical protein